MFGPLRFLSKRREVFGPNYAALGRIIIGEYATCSKMIQSPQKRGFFLGRAKLVARKLPKNFPLFLSDEDAGGTDAHSVLHQHFWETLIPPAFDRLSDPAFQTYVSDAVSEIKRKGGERIKLKDQQAIISELTIKYVFHSIFGAALTKEQIKMVHTLFIGSSPLSSYITGVTKPFSTLTGCFQCKRSSCISSMTRVLSDSPALVNYVPSDATLNLSKEDYAELLLPLAGIAGCLGSMNLCLQILNAIPTDYPIDLNNKMEVSMAVLEAARIKSPVNNVNMILQEELKLTCGERERTFPPGTIVAASIGLASVDPSKFENPHKFDPDRKNLLSSTLNFNHVGFDPVGSGTRQCPGRNIAMKMGSDLLIELRKSYTPPEGAPDGFKTNE